MTEMKVVEIEDETPVVNPVWSRSLSKCAPRPGIDQWR